MSKICLSKTPYTTTYENKTYDKIAVVYKEGERVDMLKLPKAKADMLHRDQKFEVKYGYNSKDKTYYISGIELE